MVMNGRLTGSRSVVNMEDQAHRFRLRRQVLQLFIKMKGRLTESRSVV